MTKTKGGWRNRFSGPERAFLFEAISSPIGRSLFVPIFFGLVIFSTGFLFPTAEYFGISVHLLDLLPLFVSTSVFLLSKLIRNHKNEVLSNVLVWSLAGVSSALASTVFLLVVSGKVADYLFTQVPVGFIAYTLNIAMTAVITAGVRISRSRLRQLKSNKKVLSQIRSELEQQIETMKIDIKKSVDEELAKALLALKGTRDPKALSARLFDAIDEVIRPLSHKLSGLSLKTPIPAPTNDAIRIAPNHKGVALSRLAAPEIYFLFFAVFILPASLFVQGPTGLAVNCVLLVVQVLVLLFIESRATQLVVNRFLGMGLLALQAALVGSLYPILINQTSDFGISVGFVTTSLGVTGIMALVSKRLDDLNQLAIVNQELQEVVAVLRQEAWVTKHQLAKAIHGSVQARFLAVALRIANTTKLTPSELAEARKDIRASIIDVESSIIDKTATFATQLKTITEAWDGVAKIRVKADRSTIKLINQFPLARTCVLEVIGEAVANAAKHSKAPTMDIELQENDVKQVVVSVWSAGRLANKGGRKGYGSRMLDEVTSSWSLTNLKGRVYLRAVIPLSK